MLTSFAFSGNSLKSLCPLASLCTAYAHSSVPFPLVGGEVLDSYATCLLHLELLKQLGHWLDLKKKKHLLHSGEVFANFKED